MKNTIKKLSTLLILIVFVTSTQMVYAYPSDRECETKEGQENGKGERFQNLIEKLDLTPEQKETLLQQRTANGDKMKQIRDELKEARKNLHKELKTPETNEGMINSQVAKIKELQGQLIDLRVSSFLEMKKVLTSEQMEKMSQMHKQFKGRKHKKNGEKRQSEES